MFVADVTNYDETEHALQRCEVEVGPVDILINCAGYAYPSKLEDIPLEHIKVKANFSFLSLSNIMSGMSIEY